MSQRQHALQFVVLVLAVLSAGLAVHVSPAGSDRPPFNESEDAIIPEGFLFGAGTASLQVEGAEHADGKGPSAIDAIFDLFGNATNLGFTLIPPGDAAKSYEKYAEDVEMAKQLKLQVYRFSISWPRVLPDGHVTNVNKNGTDYYHKLIDLLLENHIQPLVTMHHLDYPRAIMLEVGSWSNESIVEPFVAYADFLFKEYGDKVKLWTTINEPNYYCMNFALVEFAGVYTRQPGDDWKCIHNSNLAHAAVYRLYERKYRAKQGGKIGAAALAMWARPNSTSWDDVEAAERANVFGLGSIFHPVVFGDYPDMVKERVRKYSKGGVSRLPEFTPKQKEDLKGSADFLCFNAYMGTFMRDATYDERPENGTITSDRDAAAVGIGTVPGHFQGEFMRSDSHVLREAPRWIYRQYKKPILITENGWGDERSFDTVDPRDDGPRVGYCSEYLHQLLRVMREDNVDVMGYMAWSLIDSYEFTAGFTRKFGLAYVDFKNGTYKRSLKKSAWFFQYIGEKRRVPKIAFRMPSAASSSLLSSNVLVLTLISALCFLIAPTH